LGLSMFLIFVAIFPFFLFPLSHSRCIPLPSLGPPFDSVLLSCHAFGHPTAFFFFALFFWHPCVFFLILPFFLIFLVITPVLVFFRCHNFMCFPSRDFPVPFFRSVTKLTKENLVRPLFDFSFSFLLNFPTPRRVVL